jgi:hypothetical protein
VAAVASITIPALRRETPDQYLRITANFALDYEAINASGAVRSRFTTNRLSALR